MASKATCGIRKRTWRPRRSAAPWLSSGFSPLDKGRARPYRRPRIHPRSSRVSDLPIDKMEIKGLGGLPLAVHVVGQGRDLVLIHGYFSTAWTNWIRYGHAASLVEAGFRPIRPDLRGHGASGIGTQTCRERGGT